jgi:hypothetical protein
VRTIFVASWFRYRVLACGLALLALALFGGVPVAQADLSGSGSAPTQSTNISPGSGSGSGSNGCAAPSGCGIYDLLNPVAESFNWSFLPSTIPSTNAAQRLANDEKYSADARSNENPLVVLGNQQLGGLPDWGYYVHELPGYPTGDNAIVGWNIEIWRQGETNPIFVRTVCNPSDAFAGNPAYNTLWLDCGVASPSAQSGEFSANGQEAGVLGEETAAEKAQCLNNLNDGDNGRRNAKGQALTGPRAVAGAKGLAIPNGANVNGGDDTAVTARPSVAPSGSDYYCYWEGPSELGKYAYGSSYEISTNNTSQYNSQGPIKDEFATVGDGGLGSAGLQESVYLTWTISKTNHEDTLTYAIDGVPNTYYAVDITAINWKDKEMPVFTGNPFASSSAPPSQAALKTYLQSSQVGGAPGGFPAPPAPTLDQIKTAFDGSANPQYLRVFEPNASLHCVPPTPLHCYSPPSCVGGVPTQGHPIPCGGSSCPQPPPVTPYCYNPPTCVDVDGTWTWKSGSAIVCTSNVSSSMPVPTVDLNASSPVQTREPSAESIALTLDTPITEQQAVFPEFASLQHITPQSAFNGTVTDLSCAQGSYCPDYVRYDSDVGLRAPVLTGGGHTVSEAVLPQVPALTTNSKNLGDLAVNTFQTTWLQGTLSNPCANTEKNLGGSDDAAGDLDLTLVWPINLANCTPDGSVESTDPATSATEEAHTVNAWDDYMNALVTWEARWVSNTSTTPTYGYIHDQLLRCNSPLNVVLTDVITNDYANDGGLTLSGYDPNGDAGCPLSERYFGLSDVNNASAATQYAQGYVDANNPTNDVGGNENAAVEVFLDTNVPDSNITEMAMWDRVSGTVVGAGNPSNISSTPGQEMSNTQQPITNTRSQYKELNFCEQGVASGLSVYESKTNPGKDKKTNASDVGDPACEGYAVHWIYSSSSTTCDVSTENAPAPTASTFPAPTADQPTAAAQSIVTSWGVYGQEYSDSQMAYNPTNDPSYQYFGAAANNVLWQPDAAMRAAGFANAMTPPYSGQRPGRSGSTDYSVQHCNKVVSGHWTTGHWQKSWTFTPTQSCTIDMLQENYTADDGAFSDGEYHNLDTGTYGTKGELGTATDQQPGGAPAESGTVCSGPNYSNPSSTGSNSAMPPPAQIPPPAGVASSRSVINYAVDEGSANGSGCPANTATEEYVGCNYSKSRPVNHRYVWTAYALYKHKPTTDTVYTFGYWHYEWHWVWGATTIGGTPDPYDCSTTITNVSQTDAASAPIEYAGPLIASKSYGTDDSHIVYDYSGTSEDPNQSGNDTAYNATDPSYWEGTTYSDSAGDVNGGASGNYGSPAGSSGASSWTCTVIRHNGWQTAGAWAVDPNLGSGGGNFSNPDGTTTAAILPGPGWGVNNTGPRVANGEYNVQFTFSGLTQGELAAAAPAGGFCAEHTPNAEGTVANYCWAMWADYDGQTDAQWSHETQENNPLSDSSSAVISVFAPRDTR